MPAKTMLQCQAEIVTNRPLTSECWELTLRGATEICERVEPGQFVNLRIADTMDPLFRRPFSVVKTPPLGEGQLGLTIVYRIVGRGTRKLAGLGAGEQLDVLGPCGTGFRVQEGASAHVLLAGGMGAACIYLLGERTFQALGAEDNRHVLLGGRSKDSLILLEDFQRLGTVPKTATDDGTQGYGGTVTELLARLAERGEIPKGSAIYACGPEPMYRALRALCTEYSFSAQVALERKMACGMGVCLSCVCKVRRRAVEGTRSLSDSHVQFVGDDDIGYALTCRDGPVFSIEEVILNG